MLRAVGVLFEPVDSEVNERAFSDALGLVELAKALAQAKALHVAQRAPGRLTLGADQTLECAGRIFHKARDREQARAHLAFLRGKTHRLRSAAALAQGDDVLWSCVAEVELTMRDFSDAFLAAYLDAAGPDILSSVGLYRMEELGLQLFDNWSGDHFSILGLPLRQLLAALRAQGHLLD